MPPPKTTTTDRKRGKEKGEGKGCLYLPHKPSIIWLLLRAQSEQYIINHAVTIGLIEN